jgi:hypothetical protein
MYSERELHVQICESKRRFTMCLFYLASLYRNVGDLFFFKKRNRLAGDLFQKTLEGALISVS